MKTITLKRLKELGACADELLKFEQLFGAEVAVTEEAFVKHYQDFNFNWAANNLLSAHALVDYERVIAHALADYERVRDAALAEYDRVSDPVWDECMRVIDPASAEYERVRDAAWAEYRRVRAITFCRLFNGGE